jgi:hypothetical protein
MMLSDPAMWPYLLDPELLALVVIIGFRYAWLEIDLLRVQLLAFAHVRLERYRGHDLSDVISVPASEAPKPTPLVAAPAVPHPQASEPMESYESVKT